MLFLGLEAYFTDSVPLKIGKIWTQEGGLVASGKDGLARVRYFFGSRPNEEKVKDLIENYEVKFFFYKWVEDCFKLGYLLPIGDYFLYGNSTLKLKDKYNLSLPYFPSREPKKPKTRISTPSHYAREEQEYSSVIQNNSENIEAVQKAGKFPSNPIANFDHFLDRDTIDLDEFPDIPNDVSSDNVPNWKPFTSGKLGCIVLKSSSK